MNTTLSIKESITELLLLNDFFVFGSTPLPAAPDLIICTNTGKFIAIYVRRENTIPFSISVASLTDCKNKLKSYGVKLKTDTLAYRVLQKLKENEVVLLNAFDMPKKKVQREVSRLRQKGYDIETWQKIGYRLKND